MSFHEARLRSACLERCAEFGDPPCYDLDNWDPEEKDAYCVACRKECGEDVDDDPVPLDEHAVVRPLL